MQRDPCRFKTFFKVDTYLQLECVMIYRFYNKTLPRCVQSSTPVSRSQAGEKEEGWHQEGHSVIKEVAQKNPMHEESEKEWELERTS